MGKKDKVLVYDWTRPRPRQDDFKCGWCAYFEPDSPQEENFKEDTPLYTFDGEVSLEGTCRGIEPVKVCFSDPKGVNYNEDSRVSFQLGTMAGGFGWGRVKREQTACPRFKSCFRKKESEPKRTNEDTKKKGGKA